jgi:large subunit ribosomal protein L9
MPTTEVILTEKIESLGAEADIVKVKAGYARNFLIPRGKAYEVTPTNRKRLNGLKHKRAEREARELNEAEELGRRINKLKLNLELETGEQGKAFGSITAADLAEKVKAELGGKIEIDRHRFVLDKPIKETGQQTIPVKLHPDVTATLLVIVKAKGDEEAKADADKGAADEEKKPTGYKAKAKAKHAK